MLRPWVTLLLQRWFLTGRKRRIPALSVLPVLGLATGVAALIVVLGVMNGFQGGYIDSILEVSSFHLRIEGEESASFEASVAAIPGVRSILPFTELRCLGSSARRNGTIINLIALPQDAFTRDPGFATALGLAEASIPGPDTIIMGSELARRLEVRSGESCTLITVAGDTDAGIETKDATFRVQGEFRSGYLDFDAGLALVSFEGLKRLQGVVEKDAVVYGVKLHNRYADERLTQGIVQATGIDTSRIESWRTYNRAFFGALRTEKIVMMLLVGLIFLVVGVNIHHAMRRNVAQRMVEIAVVRALGGHAAEISRIFILDGLAVGTVGAVFGLAIGLSIIYNINPIFDFAGMVMNALARFFTAKGGDYRVFSSAYFYLVEVPVRVSVLETAFIALAATASSTLAAWMAVGRLARLDPAQVLRYE